MATAAEFLKNQEAVIGPTLAFPPKDQDERRRAVEIKTTDLRSGNFGRAVLPIVVILAAIVAAAIVAFVLSNPFALAIIGLIAAGAFLFLTLSHAIHTYSVIQTEKEMQVTYPTCLSKIGKFFSEIGATLKNAGFLR